VFQAATLLSMVKKESEALRALEIANGLDWCNEDLRDGPWDQNEE